ncbi:MAG: hypothetical protein U0842_18005 [Candidatus Binatia bacterium]
MRGGTASEIKNRTSAAVRPKREKTRGCAAILRGGRSWNDLEIPYVTDAFRRHELQG